MTFFLDFNLPEELIATSPESERDSDRMIVFQNDALIQDYFYNIVNMFQKGDLIVFNNSKVFKARLDIFSMKSDIVSELLLIQQESPQNWTAMIKKARRFKTGDFFQLADGTRASIIGIKEDGLRLIEFERDFFPEDADQIGQVPLPSYIINERKKRGEDLYTKQDEERYQTLFAKYYGSVAAPTASLRFSEKILFLLKEKGVLFDEITLHIGIGTFKPMDCDPEEFQIHREKISVSQKTIENIQQIKQQGGRIIAAGTTVCRALETAVNQPFDGWTDIFIKPGYEFQVVDGLITNFHLPNSTLLLLVQSFIGIENTKHIYETALEEKYRFYSYGDGMLLFP